MKTILLFGIVTMGLAYLFFSFGNHTWDPMQYNSDSTYWFGAISFLGWMTGLIVAGLGLDEDIKELKKSRKLYDDLYDKSNKKYNGW